MPPFFAFVYWLSRFIQRTHRVLAALAGSSKLRARCVVKLNHHQVLQSSFGQKLSWQRRQSGVINYSVARQINLICLARIDALHAGLPQFDVEVYEILSWANAGVQCLVIWRAAATAPASACNGRRRRMSPGNEPRAGRLRDITGRKRQEGQGCLGGV